MPTTRMMRLVVTGLLLVGMSSGGALAADDAAALREVRDRQQIEDLMWRYARALDSLDAEAYAAVYAEDGEFVSPGGSTKGRAALKTYIEGVAKSRDERRAKGENPTGTLHMVTNHRITFKDSDHARIDAYWLTMFPGSGAETPARIGGVGRSVEDLVRVKGQWLIQRRDVAPVN